MHGYSPTPPGWSTTIIVGDSRIRRRTHKVNFFLPPFAAQKYSAMTGKRFLEAKATPKDAPSVKSNNPFDNLDCE